MQPRRLGTVAASLLLAATMVFGFGVAAASLTGGMHAATPAKTTAATAHTPMPNAAAVTALLHQTVHAGPVHTTSSNWAGYANVATAGTIYEVTAEWFNPTVTCPTTHSGASYLATWVGIDGYGTGTVEQDGTFAYCSGGGATPVYYDWFEFYPYESVQFVSTIGAGDLVQAYVLYNPAACINSVCGIYTLSFADLSAGSSWQVTGNPSLCNTAGCEGGPDGSAECISEAPGVGGGIAAVAHYSPYYFYACADTIGNTFAGIGSHGTHATDYQINQVGASTLTDQTAGNLISYFYGLSEFKMTWHHYA